MKLVLPATMEIVVPTRARPSVRTLSAFPAVIRDRIQLVVRHDEESIYRAAGNTRLVVMPPGVEGLSPTRQWILDNINTRYLCMLDDDISQINFKPEISVFGGLRAATELEIIEGVQMLNHWLRDGCAHCGFLPRTTAASSTTYTIENVLHMQFLCYNTSILKGEGIRFDRLRLAQDKDVGLTLIERGYSNRLSVQFSFSCAKTDHPGGCAVYRTHALREEVAAEFARIHAPHVRVVQKPVGGVMTTKHIVYWKKAFKSRINERKLP